LSSNADGQELVRLAVSTVDPDSQQPMGIFQAAYRLRRYTCLDAARKQDIDRELTWFQEHLATPQRFVHTRSKGYYRRPPVAVSWFRAGATEHLRRAEVLGGALAACGLPVQRLRTQHPGYVVYEDDHQVVAVPFRDR